MQDSEAYAKTGLGWRHSAQLYVFINNKFNTFVFCNKKITSQVMSFLCKPSIRRYAVIKIEDEKDGITGYT